VATDPEVKISILSIIYQEGAATKLPHVDGALLGIPLLPVKVRAVALAVSSVLAIVLEIAVVKLTSLNNLSVARLHLAGVVSLDAILDLSDSGVDKLLGSFVGRRFLSVGARSEQLEGINFLGDGSDVASVDSGLEVLDSASVDSTGTLHGGGGDGTISEGRHGSSSDDSSAEGSVQELTTALHLHHHSVTERCKRSKDVFFHCTFAYSSSVYNVPTPHSSAFKFRKHDLFSILLLIPGSRGGALHGGNEG
ncbi:unnamed protein product, partial [Heterosigma akashiwo]